MLWQQAVWSRVTVGLGGHHTAGGQVAAPAHGDWVWIVSSQGFCLKQLFEGALCSSLSTAQLDGFQLIHASIPTTHFRAFTSPPKEAPISRPSPSPWQPLTHFLSLWIGLF